MPWWFWLSVTGYAIIALGVWYLLCGLNGYLNGGHGVFTSFARNVTWYMPGGLKRRTAFIKEKVDSLLGLSNTDGVICGSKRSWSYKEVRDQNLYEVCAKDVLGNPLEFLAETVFIPLTWIVSVPVGIVVIWVANLLYKEKDSTKSEAE